MKRNLFATIQAVRAPLSCSFLRRYSPQISSRGFQFRSYAVRADRARTESLAHGMINKWLDGLQQRYNAQLQSAPGCGVARY
jgi:hypothetical protein